MCCCCVAAFSCVAACSCPVAHVTCLMSPGTCQSVLPCRGHAAYFQKQGTIALKSNVNRPSASAPDVLNSCAPVKLTPHMRQPAHTTWGHAASHGIAYTCRRTHVWIDVRPTTKGGACQPRVADARGGLRGDVRGRSDVSSAWLGISGTGGTFAGAQIQRQKASAGMRRATCRADEFKAGSPHVRVHKSHGRRSAGPGPRRCVQAAERCRRVFATL